LSYHDIDVWASESIPPELFESFSEWIDAIEKNFAHHGHYFPNAMVDTLREVWEDKYGYEINESEYRHEKSIATGKTYGYEEQFLKQRLA